MDLDQTTIMDKEHKKLKLHNDDSEEDETTSYPSKKWVKHDLDLPEEKPVVADHGSSHMFDFRRYTKETGQVFEGVVIECEKEIEACQKAYTDASHFFDIKFGDLEKEHVVNYVEYRNGPLSCLKLAEDRYFKKTEELAEDVISKGYNEDFEDEWPRGG